jgi:hypothetical protein
LAVPTARLPGRNVLAHVVKKKRNHLKSLSLPIQIHRDTSPATFADLAPPRDKLLEVCEANGVRVIWRTSVEKGDDVGVSKEFWQYAKELKRKRIEAEGGA